MPIHPHSQVCNLGGEGGKPPCYFLKLEKKWSNSGKKAQIVSIFQLDFPIKMFV